MPIGFDDLVHGVMNDWPATIQCTTHAENITSITMPS